jgi:hypothetical protein
MKEVTKMIVLSCIFLILSMATVFTPYLPIRNLCYFLVWCMGSFYFLISLILLLDSVNGGEVFVKTATNWGDILRPPIPFLIVLICSIGIVTLIMDGKFILGALCMISIIIISAYISAINNYHKKKG